MDTPPDPRSDSSDADLPEPVNLRFLRRLVTLLTATMIAGLVVLILVFVIRFRAPDMPLPENIALPDGAEAYAVTISADWIIVLTTSQDLMLFERGSGRLSRTLALEPAPDTDP